MDLVRQTRGAYPGPILEPNETIRKNIVYLGGVGVRYGGYGLSLYSGVTVFRFGVFQDGVLGKPKNIL